MAPRTGSPRARRPVHQPATIGREPDNAGSGGGSWPRISSPRLRTSYGRSLARSLSRFRDLQALRNLGKHVSGAAGTRLHSVRPCRSESASPEQAGPQIVACQGSRVTRAHAWDGTHGAQGFSECESSDHRCGLVCVDRVPGHPGTSVCTTTGSASQKRPVIVPIGAVSPASSHRGTVDRYCVTCHNQRLATAGLKLDEADIANPGQGAEIWEKVCT